MRTLRTLLALVRLELARVGAVLRPARSIVAGPGRAVAALAAGSSLAGTWLGWPELGYLGLTLAAAVLVAFGFLIGRGRFTVDIELSPRRVVAGQRAFGRLLVANTAARRSSATRMELPVGSRPLEFAIPPLVSGQQHEELFAVPTDRRCVIVAGPVRSVRGDPLGLVRRTVRWSDPIELFVHPVTVPLRLTSSGRVHDLEGEVSGTVTDSDLAFHALRPYVPGDDRRHVHWRSTARMGHLMVRQFVQTRRSEFVLLHHAAASSYLGMAGFDREAFELGVSGLASVAAQLLRERTRVRVLSGSTGDLHELRVGTPRTMLDDASRIEPRLGRGTLREFAREASRRTAAPPVLLLMVGPAVPVAELRAVDAVLGGQTRMLALRIEPGAGPQVSSVSDLTLLTLGALADLPSLLGRVW